MKRPKLNRPNVKLGDKCHCRVSGFAGVATAIATYIDGCTQVCLQPKVGKDRKRPDVEWFYIERLAVDKAGAVKLDTQETGGPQSAPARG